MPEPVYCRTLRRSQRRVCAVLVLAGSLSASGCLFGKKKSPRVFVPPPIYAKDPVVPARPPDLTAPPEALPVDAGVNVAIVAGPLPPAPPKPAPPKPPAPAKPPAVVATENPAPAPPPPKPATIFTAEERRQMTQELDGLIDRVTKALARTEGRVLSAEQTALATNARTFLLQAEQTRVQDLVTAVSLAKRAESYAMELVQRLP